MGDNVAEETVAVEEEAIRPDAESVPEPSTEPAAVADEPEAPGGGPRQIRLSVTLGGLFRVLIAVALVAALGVTVWLYLDARRDLRAERESAAATARAEQVALDYAAGAARMDYQNLADWKVRLVAGTTPELNARLTKAAKSMEQILVPLQWNSSARPLAAKARAVSDGVYTVDAFVGVLTKTVQSAEGLPSTATYSVTVDSNKNWQISDVGGVGDVLQPK